MRHYKMIRFALILELSLGVYFSQETDSLLINNIDSSIVSVKEFDSLITNISILPSLDSTLNDSAAINGNISGENNLQETTQPLPIVRDIGNRTVEMLEEGKPFFEIKSSIDILRQQVDSLKKIISVYEEGKGAMPNINEELLDLIKIPQLRHRIELQNGTAVSYTHLTLPTKA